MRLHNDGNYSYLSAKDEYGRINNEQIFIIAKSGWGKGLATAGVAQAFYNEGYQVIYLADPKDECELGYALFEPEESYHLKELQKTGIRPKAMPTKLYHPFTFSLARTQLPDMNVFTLPIKDLTTDEFAFLAETDYQTETVKLFMNSAQNIPDNAGIYSFLHKIQDLAKGSKTGRTVKATAANKYLEVSAGTAKSITEALSIMNPFFRDYFLSSKTCPLNLDFKTMLSDHEHYHVFLAHHMPYKKNKKIRDFLVLALMSQILSNIKHAKHPLLLIIPEISNQIPARPEGHEKFLAKALRRLITTCRSKGRGVSTISDNQTLVDMDEGYSNSCTVTLLGQLAGARDVDRIYKSYGYKQEIRKRLLNPTYKNSFTLVGHEDEEMYIRFPSHRWAESETNFEDLYARFFKEKMVNYSEMINKMSADLKNEEEKFRDKAKKKEQALKKAQEEKERAKEEGDTKDKKVDKMKEQKEKAEEKSKESEAREVGRLKEENTKISNREIGRRVGINPHTVKKRLALWEKIKEKEELVDYEGDALDALEEIDEETKGGEE